MSRASTFSIVRNAFPERREIVPYLTILVLFTLTTKLFQGIYFGINTAPAVIWPPAGIAFAGMLLYGYRMWSAITIGTFLAAIFSFSWPVLIASIIAGTIQPVVGTYLFRKLKFNLTLSTLYDALIVIFGSAIVGMIFPSLQILIRVLLGNGPVELVNLWESIWAGQVLSLIFIVSFAASWFRNWRIEYERGYTIEATLIFAALIAIDYVLFWTHNYQIAGISLVYLMLVPFFWIAIRFRPRLMTLSLFITAIISITGTLFVPPLPQAAAVPLGTRLFQLQIFLEIIAAMFIILVSVVEERRKATKELKEQITRLEIALSQIQEQDKAKTESLAVLAHELRNPLSPVLSTLEILQMNHARTDGSGDNEMKLLRAAEDRVKVMAHLLDDLLDISRISQKRFKLEKSKVELHAVVMNAIDTIRKTIEARNHRLTVSIPKEKIWLDIDEMRFEQVLVNLLDNAAKYTDPHGEITLHAKLDDDGLSIRINDNGAGIPPEMLENIFEPFLQVHQRSYKASGLGLGLSLTRRLMEMHGGTITAKSDGLGKGSEFIVHLPASAVLEVTRESFTGNAIPEPLERTLPNVPSHFKILVVDDNEAAAQGLGKLLELRGHQVTLAYDGKSALDAVSIFDPHIVVLDIGLPDIDGYEVAEILRRENHRSILIALTGYGQAEDKIRAEQAGFNYHLTKPIGLADIEAVFVKIPVA